MYLQHQLYHSKDSFGVYINKLPASMRPKVQRIDYLIDAINATNNFEMQRIRSIFVVNFATNEGFHISTR